MCFPAFAVSVTLNAPRRLCLELCLLNVSGLESSPCNSGISGIISVEAEHHPPSLSSHPTPAVPRVLSAPSFSSLCDRWQRLQDTKLQLFYFLQWISADRKARGGRGGGLEPIRQFAVWPAASAAPPPTSSLPPPSRVPPLHCCCHWANVKPVYLLVCWCRPPPPPRCSLVRHFLALSRVSVLAERIKSHLAPPALPRPSVISRANLAEIFAFPFKVPLLGETM